MFKILTRWNRGGSVVCDDTGYRIAADTSENAVSAAVRMGAVSGLGFRRDYIDCIAERVDAR